MDLAAITVIGGAVVTLVTSLLKMDLMSAKVKNLIAVVLSAVAAGVSVWLSGDLAGTEDIMLAVTSMYGISQAVYAFILKNSGLDSVLAGIRTLPTVGDQPVYVEDQADDPEHADEVDRGTENTY